ncbi:MAG: efflux RND transporter permease subunit [Bacillus sp. (in: Bacteria)]|nr:efflux RND transporter permease subunit [Bacillus sp. (in: firmicutes)]
MKLLEFIVKRKILVGLLTFLVLFVGSYGMAKLDKELFPSVAFDGAFISINAGEQPALEIERNITSPLERQLQSIEGVEQVQSSTSYGRTTINMLFERGKGDELIKEVESVVNTTTAGMQEINHLYVGQYGTNQPYEFYMDLADGDMDVISAFATDVLKPRLEDLKEVREVALEGLKKYELNIALNQENLLKYGLDPSHVIGTIQGANSEFTLGELSQDSNSPTVRFQTTLSSLEAIENIKLPTQEGFIALHEIASVTIDPVENTGFVWKNGSSDFIFLQIGRTANVTQIEMAEAVRGELQQIRDEGLVKGFTMNEMVAQADYVSDSIEGISSNILIGAAIAIAILLLFLQNIRATAIIAISIPTSILLTFTAMWLFDYSVNMITLIGLGLGIGMMVDASIVILESIYRKREQGLERLQAVLEGTKEVATAVFASMLTTIVVFLPIGLVGGELGQFMMILSMVVAITLISSVVVSFTVIPSLSEKFMKLKKNKGERKEGRLVIAYSRLISWIVRRKRNSLAVIGLFMILFIGSMFLVPKIPMTIMPDVLNRYAEMGLELEQGLTHEDKEAIVEYMYDSLAEIQDVEDVYVIDNGNMLFAAINMTKGDDITREQLYVNEDISRSLRELVEEHPVKNVIDLFTGGGGSPVQVTITGEDFEELKLIADEFIGELNGIEGLVGIYHSMERTRTEEIIRVSEEELEAAGLTPMQLKGSMEMAFLHMPLGEIKMDEDTIPLFIKWDQPIGKKEELLDWKVSTFNGEEALSKFISLGSVSTPNEIIRIDGERSISIYADMEGRDLGSVNRDVQTAINEFNASPGYALSVAGDLEEQQALMMEMLLVLGIAIFLVYLVMAVQFNHLAHPLIVMSIIPMTMVGVIGGLFITQRELNVLSAMGVIMLIGIVLNNAILLIDRTNKLRLEGYGAREAIVEAGKNRIRPIFMTTLTTSGGMLPLALASGASGNYQAPMATVIITGLLFATLITLLLIPSVYNVFTSSKKKNGRKAEEKSGTELEEIKQVSIL